VPGVTVPSMVNSRVTSVVSGVLVGLASVVVFRVRAGAPAVRSVLVVMSPPLSFMDISGSGWLRLAVSL